MSKYLLRGPAENSEEEQPAPERNKKIRFKFDAILRESRTKRDCNARDEFLHDWPHPEDFDISAITDEFCDLFPLFQPSIARYFDQDDRPLLQLGRQRKKDLSAGDASTETDHPATGTQLPGQDYSVGRGGLIDKRYVYTSKGTIKDFYCLFRPAASEPFEEGEGLTLPDEVNRQILLAMAGSASAETDPTDVASPSGDTDGWDEDEHTPGYWQERTREVDFFVKHHVWSIDPIGDWSHLNHQKVPGDFLRKLRRYLEIRPLEYLQDTGSYRMFHVLNQYKDLRGILDRTDSVTKKISQGVRNWTIGCCGRQTPIDQARRMELDYIAMIWLSIWDPRLKENVFQMNEISMSDWFFTRVGWSSAVGVQELLTKNELHSMDDLWAHRAARKLADEDDEGDFEELEDWITGEGQEGDSESQQSSYVESSAS